MDFAKDREELARLEQEEAKAKADYASLGEEIQGLRRELKIAKGEKATVEAALKDRLKEFLKVAIKDHKRDRGALRGATKKAAEQARAEFADALKAADLKVKEINDELEKKLHRYKHFFVSYKPEMLKEGVALRVIHLKQFFDMGGNYKTKAVHDISFDIKEGECFGLVGESGCGKTTTGRSIIGLYDITSGSIYYEGYRISAGDRWNRKEIKWSRIRTNEEIKRLKEECKAKIKAMETDGPSVESGGEDGMSYTIKRIEDDYEAKIKELREALKVHCEIQKKYIKRIDYDNKHRDRKLLTNIQMIFQDPIDSLDPRMTVEDIIQEGLKIQHHHNKAENHAKCVEMLEKVGLLADYASRYPHEFSGGQRQRIGIARALVMNPKLLICDEPISALDVSIRAQILNLLNDVKQEMGLTMLFIAHDLSVVKYFCDRIAVMYFGSIVELATSDELFRHPLHPYTKALLSAIPKPDPYYEKNRTRLVYDPSTAHDYSVERPSMVEILPGHFVYASPSEVERYKAEIAEDDRKARTEENEENARKSAAKGGKSE